MFSVVACRAGSRFLAASSALPLPLCVKIFPPLSPGPLFFLLRNSRQRSQFAAQMICLESKIQSLDFFLLPYLPIGVLLLLLAGCVHAPQTEFPLVSALASQPNLPDPLVMLDGQRVTSRGQWFNQRRPELKALFAHYMYGPIPARPDHMETKLVGTYPDFLAGTATLKLFTLQTAPPNGPQIDLMLIVPNQRRGPVPVFLAMDFCGNHALTSDSRVPLARSWMANSCKGCANNAATEKV